MFITVDQSGVFSFSIPRVELLSDPRVSSPARCERSWAGLVVFDDVLNLLLDSRVSYLESLVVFDAILISYCYIFQKNAVCMI